MMSHLKTHKHRHFMAYHRDRVINIESSSHEEDDSDEAMQHSDCSCESSEEEEYRRNKNIEKELDKFLFELDQCAGEKTEMNF